MRASTNYYIKLNRLNQMIDIIGSDETADPITIIKIRGYQMWTHHGLYQLFVHQNVDGQLFADNPSYAAIIKCPDLYSNPLIIPNFDPSEINSHKIYVDFVYDLQFHQSNDTPYPCRTYPYESIKLLGDENTLDETAVVDTFSAGFYTIPGIGMSHFEGLYKTLIDYNLANLSKQFIYEVLGIRDFMTDVIENFDFFVKLYNASDETMIGKWRIDQDGINAAFEAFFNIDLSDEFDSKHKPVLDFSIFGKKFHILRMPKLPMHGYMLSKKIVQKYFEEEKNRIAFDFPKVEIEVYSRKDMSEIDCFAFSGKDSRGWSTFDILEVIPTVLDLLALKYKASVKCTLSFTGSKKLIVTDQYSALHERENLFFRYLKLLK